MRVRYFYEPEIAGAADFDPSHLVFINQSRADLDTRLRAFCGLHPLRLSA